MSKKGARAEPKVVAADVQVVLRRVVRPGQEDDSASVHTIANRAQTSTRTVYRVLQGTTDTLSLDLADRLCIAAGTHLSECRLSWPDGDVTPYWGHNKD